MSFLLLKAFPSVVVSVVAGGFVASTFGTDVLFNTAESKKEIEGGDAVLDVKVDEAVVPASVNNPQTTPVPVRTSPQLASGSPVTPELGAPIFTYTVENAQNYYPSHRDVDDGVCNLYVVESHHDGNLFTYKRHTLYTSLESLPQRSKISNVQKNIKCNKNKHFYIFDSLFGWWNVKVSNKAPIKQQKNS